jgi:hypothetical protein
MIDSKRALRHVLCDAAVSHPTDELNDPGPYSNDRNLDVGHGYDDSK